MMKRMLLILIGAACSAGALEVRLLAPGTEGPVTLSYGTHERNTLDLWQAAGNEPHALLIYIHGGSWTGADKSQIAGRVDIEAWRVKGVSVASIDYRYSTDAILPAPVHDAVHAVQFLKYKAQELKLDSSRFVLQGGSAGGCSPLYLSYPSDMTLPPAMAAAAIHHGRFGMKLKEQADAIGYTNCTLNIPGTVDAEISATPSHAVGRRPNL